MKQPARRPSNPHTLAESADRSITLAGLEHLARLQTIRQASQLPANAAVPDPPSYRRCTARLAQQHGSAGGAAAATFKSECRKEYETVRASTLTSWIIDAWISAEAARMGLTVSLAETDRQIGKEGIKHRLLREFGAKPADLRPLVKPDLLEHKIFATLPAFGRMRRAAHETMQMADEIDNEDAAYATALKRKWTPRTACQRVFLVIGCSGFTSGPPS